MSRRVALRSLGLAAVLPALVVYLLTSVLDPADYVLVQGREGPFAAEALDGADPSVRGAVTLGPLVEGGRLRAGDVLGWVARVCIRAGVSGATELTMRHLPDRWPVRTDTVPILVGEHRCGAKPFAVRVPADAPPGRYAFAATVRLHPPGWLHFLPLTLRVAPLPFEVVP